MELKCGIQLELDLDFPKSEKLWGQRSPFACLVNKDEDFEAELRLFLEIAPYHPAICGLFSRY